jgi:hypothetical protein
VGRDFLGNIQGDKPGVPLVLRQSNDQMTMSGTRSAGYEKKSRVSNAAYI